MTELDNTQVSAYSCAMRRREGTLVPIELEILRTAMLLKVRGTPSFHGFKMAQALRDHGDDRDLAGHGTLYRALSRLERLGYLTSRWESADAALKEHRPRRRLYNLTGEGEAALGVAARELRRAPRAVDVPVTP